MTSWVTHSNTNQGVAGHVTPSDWWRRRASLSLRDGGYPSHTQLRPLCHVRRSHWSSRRSSLSPRGWGGIPPTPGSAPPPPPHVTRSHWWTVTSCLSLIGRPSRAREHKKPREGLVQLSVYGQKKSNKKEKK